MDDGYYFSARTGKLREALKAQGHPAAEWDDFQLTSYLVQRDYKKAQEAGGEVDWDAYDEDYQRARRRVELKAPDYLAGAGFFGTAGEEFSRGFGSGIDSMQGGYQAVLGLAAGALGAEDTEENLLKKAQANFKQSSLRGSSMRGKFSLAFEHMLDEGDFGPMGRWLASGSGEALASGADVIASLVAGGGAGAVAIQAGKKKAISEIKDQIQDEVKDKLGGAFSAQINKKIREGASKTAGKVAFGTGVATSSSQNTGHVYSDLYQYTQLDQDDPLYMSPAEARTKSTIAGAAMGSLDSIVPTFLASKLTNRLGREQATGLVSSFVKSMPEGAIFTKDLAKGLGRNALRTAQTGAGESLTEAAQEALQMFVEKDHTGEPWTDQDMKHLVEAGALGFIGGAQMKMGTDVAGGISDLYKSREILRSKFQKNVEEAKKQKIEPTPEVQEDISKLDRTFTQSVGDTVRNIKNDKLYKVAGVSGETLNLESVDGEERLEGQKSYLYPVVKDFFDTDEDTTEVVQEDVQEEKPEVDTEEPSITVDEVYDYKDGKILNPDGGEQLAEVDYEDGEGIHFKGLKRTVDNFSEDSKEKATQVARRALKEKADKERKPFKDGDGEWQFPSRDEPWKQLEFIDKVMRSDEGSPYYGDQQFADASALETELTKNKHTIDGDTISDDDLNYKARVRVATTYNSIVDDVKGETDKDNKKITEFVNQELGLVKNQDEKRAIKSYLNQREDFEVKNNRVKYTGGYDKTSTKKTTPKKKKTSEQKEQEKRKRLIEERKETFKPNTLWNYKGSPRRVKSVSEDGDIVWGYLENQAEVFSEPESLADVKGARRYTAFRNPTVRIENNKLVPVIKPPKPPKLKIKKPKQPVGLYTRTDGDKLVVKNGVTIHDIKVTDGAKIPAQLTREPVFEINNDMFFAVGYKLDDGTTKEFEGVGETKNIDDEAVYFKGIPLDNVGRFAREFNKQVGERGDSKYVTQKTSGGKGSPAVAYREVKENAEFDLGNAEVKFVPLVAGEIDGHQLTPAQTLAGKILPPITEQEVSRRNRREPESGDEYARDVLNNHGVLSTGKKEGYSKFALVFQNTKTGAIVVRSVSFEKANPDAFGIGNHSMQVHYGRVKNTEGFNPLRVSKAGKHANASYFPGEGAVEGTPFDEDDQGVYLQGATDYRIIGHVESTIPDSNLGYFTAEHEFLDVDGLNEKIDQQNDRAIEKRSPFLRYSVALRTKETPSEEVFDGKFYNPYLHLYAPMEKREDAKNDIKELAKIRISEISAVKNPSKTTREYYKFLQEVKNTGLARVHDLDKFEANHFREVKGKKAGGYSKKPRDENYGENELILVRTTFGTMGTALGAYADLNSNGDPNWRNEEDSDTKVFKENTVGAFLFGADKKAIDPKMASRLGNLYEKYREILDLELDEDGALYKYFYEELVYKGGENYAPRFEKVEVTEDRVLKEANDIRRLSHLNSSLGRLNNNLSLLQELQQEFESILEGIPDSDKQSIINEDGTITFQVSGDSRDVLFKEAEEIIKNRISELQEELKDAQEEEAEQDYISEGMQSTDPRVEELTQKREQVEEQLKQIQEAFEDDKESKGIGDYKNYVVNPKSLEKIGTSGFDPTKAIVKDSFSAVVKRNRERDIKDAHEQLLEVFGEFIAELEGNISEINNDIEEINKEAAKFDVAIPAQEEKESTRIQGDIDRLTALLQDDKVVDKLLSGTLGEQVTKEQDDIVAGIQSLDITLQKKKASDIIRNIPALQNQALDEMQALSFPAMEFVASTDLTNLNDSELMERVRDLMLEGQVPYRIGSILAEIAEANNRDITKSEFSEAWFSDIEDATGDNLRKYIDETIASKEEEALSVDDEIKEVRTMPSQRVGAEREPNPEVAAQESDRIRTQFLQGAEPGKVIKGYDALVRAIKLVDDESTAEVLTMLQSLRKQLEQVDVVWATDEQWAAVTEQLRIEKERAGQPVPTRYGQYSPLSRGGEEDPHIMMGNYYGYVKSDGTEMTEAERLQHMIRVLAEELQHAVLYTTIESLHKYREKGYLPSYYKGKLSVKDFEYLSKSSGAIFDFLREKYAKEGKYSEILVNEQEMWASYAIDANFRAEIENLKLPKEFRARYRTTFQRVGDFFRRILSRIFTGIQEATILEMMDDHLKTFFKDSNKISSEDRKYILESLRNQPILASQQFFNFWEGKSEGKDPPLEEDVDDGFDRPTYFSYYNISRQTVKDRDFKTIAKKYFAFWGKDTDMANALEGTAMNMAEGLGLNREGDALRLQQAMLDELGLYRPTYGSDIYVPNKTLGSEMYSHTPSRSEVEQNLQKEYAALAELMKVLTEATSTLPEELQNEITENLLKNRLSVTTSGELNLNLALKAAKQKLKKGQNIKRTADREQALSKMLEKEEAEPIDSIGKFATTAERMRVARRTLELIEGSKREITKLMEKTDRIVRESEEELAKNKKRLEDLASGKRYDPDKVKKLVEKKLKSLINNTRYNNLAGMPDYNKGEFIDNLRANKVYEVLQAIIEGGMAPEQMSRQEIYDALEGQVSSADMFEGLTGERQDNVVRALLAEMLHKDTKNKARSAFSIEMRLSKNAPTRALKLEVEALRQAAISDDWKDVSTTGILGKQIDEVKQVRKQMTALNQKIAKQTQLMPLGKHLIEKYNERSMQIEDYLGSVITPEVAVGDMVDMLDLDKEGNIVPIKVKYMVSGKGYTEFVQKANRMKAILENPKYKISDAHRDAFARTYALIEQGLAKSYDATFTGTAFSHLESFSQVVSRAGDEEALMISTMINRLNTELRQYGSNAVRQGHSVSRAWYNLQAELRNGAGKKLSLEQIQQYLFNPFMAYVEGQPKIDDLNSLAEDFWSTLKRQRFKIHNDDAKAKKRWMELVQEIQVANNLIQKTAKEFNIPIEDSIKIMDPLLQKRTLYRGQIPIGALTLPRMLMVQNLRDASRALTKNDEKTNIFNQIVKSIKEKTDKNDPLFEEDYDRNSFQAELSGWKLSSDVELFFLEPTLNDYSNPRNLGWMMGERLVSMDEVSEAWNNSEGGDVGARIYQTIAELMPENVSKKDFVKNGLDFLTQINSRANAIVKKHDEYESKTAGSKENPNAIIYKAEVWNSLNSRDESVSLPSHFFTYSMMTEIDMRQMVAKMLMAHHFGRNQEKLDAAYKELLNKERELEAEWDVIYRKITDEPYPWADRDDNERNLDSRNFFNIQATKKFGLPRALRKKITSDEYEKLKSLYTKIYALKEAQKMKPAFAAYAKSQGSVLSDERAAVETLQTISSMLVANPKSAIMNLASIYQIFQLYDLQPAGFKAAFNVLKRMPVEALDTIMQGFGKNMFSAGKKQYGEEALAPLWTSLETATSDRFSDAGAKGVLGENTKTSSMRKFTRMLRTALQSGLKIPGVNNRVINMILNGEPGREKLAEEGTLTTAPGSLSTFSLIPGFSNLFSWLSNATLKHTTLEVLADLKRRVEGAAHTLDQLGVDPEDNGYELSSENMEYSNNFLGMSLRDSKEVNDRIDRELANFGLSITKLAQDFRRRRKGDLSADPILDKNKLVAAHIASTQITFDGTSAKARILDTKGGIYASPLLGWSTSMAAHANRKFRGDSRDAVDPSNIDTYRAFGVFALSALSVGVPISLFVMRGSELYDEEVLGKDPGLGYVPPEAYLPFGLLFAINDPAFRTLSLIERLGRTSSFGGIYQEAATNALLGATGESFQRDITNRIMLVSMASNLSDVFLNYLSAIDTRSADTFTPEYSSVIRPLMNIVGMNNVIQFAQYSNNLLGTEDFPLFSSEYKVTNVLNQRNKLRAITKAIGIETQKVGGGLSYRPNAMSIAIREMERSAYVGDRDSFLEAYRLALQLSDDADPKKDVADRFKRRNLRNGVSKYTLGDSDWIKLLSVLDPEDRNDIEDALLKHSYYLQLIGGKPKGESRTKRVQIDDLRRQALL